MPKQAIKLDLVKTSLLVVFLRDLSEIPFLLTLLDTALPKLAGLHLVIMTIGVEPARLTSKMGMLTSLVNSRKLARITQCPIKLP